ncbi:hypothetical protein BHU25_10985 [Pseudomonas vranovensis]|uniref:Uncharacterized protein n=1 Tax=Pseudomonas vranovensis TaxID=321661 RepID=A0A423DSK0_9PSED|nr:hypothetical protein BHU25_10985 [Pseudomonas vranovensis]
MAGHNVGKKGMALHGLGKTEIPCSLSEPAYGQTGFAVQLKQRLLIIFHLSLPAGLAVAL